MTVTLERLDAASVSAAAAAIRPHVERTATIRSAALSQLSGAEVHLKLENLQRTGAFKIRGALNRLLSLLPDERARGVVTASAGNHGQGVADAARVLGITAHVVLPRGAPLAKVAAIERLGARVVMHGGDYDEAHARAADLARELRAVYVHAFDDPLVIAGQGTVALELLEDAPQIDTIVVPVGGGGLIAGCALVARERRPRVRVIGVQASGSASFARAFASGAIAAGDAATIADGIAVRRPAERTLAIARACVDDVVTVDDEAIARAIVLLIERHKLVAEGAGAAAVAAVLAGGLSGHVVGAVVSGGNIDPILLGKVVQQGLASAGRYLAFRTWLDDRPGRLNALTEVLAAEHINILHVGINRLGPYASLGRVGLDVIVETRDRAHAAGVLALVRGRGFPAEELLDTHPGRS